MWPMEGDHVRSIIIHMGMSQAPARDLLGIY